MQCFSEEWRVWASPSPPTTHRFEGLTNDHPHPTRSAFLTTGMAPNPPGRMSQKKRRWRSSVIHCPMLPAAATRVQPAPVALRHDPFGNTSVLCLPLAYGGRLFWKAFLLCLLAATAGRAASSTERVTETGRAERQGVMVASWFGRVRRRADSGRKGGRFRRPPRLAEREGRCNFQKTSQRVRRPPTAGRGPRK